MNIPLISRLIVAAGVAFCLGLILGAGGRAKSEAETRAMHILDCDGGVAILIRSERGDHHACVYGSMRQHFQAKRKEG